MTLDASAWTALVFQLGAFYVFPPIVWAVVRRVLGVEWRWIRLGAITWLVALPALLGVPIVATIAFGGGDPVRGPLVWGAALSLTAGVAEESSRWFFYRGRPELCGPGGRRLALAAGAGHGGTEAFVLGLQYAVAPVLFAAVATELPAGFTLEGVATFAWTGGASRMLFVLAHVGFSLIVWNAVVRGGPALLLAAIALHVGVDLLAFVVARRVPGTGWLVLVPTLALVGYALTVFVAEARRPAR